MTHDHDNTPALDNSFHEHEMNVDDGELRQQVYATVTLTFDADASLDADEQENIEWMLATIRAAIAKARGE